ncbi:isoleucine--tRNA ligase, mitochondrial [Diorhabda carinulata]|uniref:isoleucine--tRNA ligase, mitochondrial n=1 Tax=Diorhabda carinulata TaxID=1163345 RepID=UPI0025A25A20|nr:isoleucine--tRNA ligase, mitochondrial [Diorhabda carinulata]
MLFKNNIRGINYINKASFCAKSQSSKKYSRTILLPKTQFPLKLNNSKIVERDESVYNSAGFEKLYDWQRAHLSEPEFILHDGPPYANGNSHMGHAINKILKDTILRSKILSGNKVHYIPGWDCHGLPIELKALTGVKEEDPIEIRNKARNFAKEAIETQKGMFKSWGVLGDWKNAYTTYSADYMKLQFRQFFKLYEKNYIYRDVKPVFWSPSSMTALAEAELEYNEKHESTSAYVKVKIIDKPKLEICATKNLYAIIWTTTPWTLPSNQGICYNKVLSYSIVKSSNFQDDLFIMSTDLVDDIAKVLNTTLEVVEVIPGSDLEGIVYQHPLYQDKTHNFISASHVSNTKGTGLVHLAGAHGPDDFLVCRENNLSIVDLIDDTGCYVTEAGPSLKGKYSLTEGNDAVLELVQDNLLHKKIITHSYPYDWRTNKPVIIKASKQWFINTESIKNRAVELLEDVKIFPADRSEIYKNNLIKQIQKRPYWCISRQRKWGVPIPILYNKTLSDVIINEDSISHYCRLVDEVGTDFWWKMNTEELLTENMYQSNDNIVKCEDIMDIWLDSGLSWSKVLDGAKVADMYLEGVDQFTGWFQSSLLTSVALRDKAPYKSIYVHGFAVDQNGIKMSKSLGNVVDPLEITTGKNDKTTYGVDVLRWWVTCHANQHALASVNTNTLDSSAEEVQKIRSVLRFAIGALSDYENENIEKSKLLFIDRYMLHLLYSYHNKALEFMENFQYHKLSNAVINFLTNSVSALYFNSIKDRLYCNIVDSTERRSAQFTLYQILEIVTQSIAPMLPHLVEELYLYFLQKQNTSYFTSEHSKPTDEWKDSKIEKLFDIILLCKRDINKEIGANTTDKVVEIMFAKDVCFYDIKPISNLKELEKQLIDILQVSNVIVTQGDISKSYRINITQSKKHVCPRCRKVNADHDDELCRRCYEAFNYLRSKSSFVIN